ncbi:MAG: XdhC family protein, partial [Methyloligellaceae bacterium]
MRKDTLKTLLDAQAARRALVLVTPLAGGDEQIISEDALDTDQPLADDIAACLRTGRSKTQETQDGEVFLQAFLPAPRLVIVGATHIAQVLVRLAREVGIEPFVIDPRTAFATEQRFNETGIIANWPGEALGELGLDRRSALVCLAHVPDIDDEALCAALRGDCFYIGALGSSRSHAKRVARL